MYVVNYHSKEIHDATSTDSRCNINNMTHCEFITRRKMERLLKQGYNGCYHCNRAFDTDMINYKKGLRK